MKRITAVALTLVLILTAAFALAEGASFKVGICNFVDDASLNQIVENIQNRLEAIAVIARRGLTVSAAEEYIESLLRARAAPVKKPPELGALLSGIDQSLSRLRTAGYKPDASRREDDSEIVLTIRIPKTAG